MKLILPSKNWSTMKTPTTVGMVQVFVKCVLIVFCFQVTAHSQSISINPTGTSPDASAMLDINSTDKGLLVPRMSEAQRTSISNPATGLIVFQTDGNSGFYYNVGTPSNASWVILIAGPVKGSDIASGVQTTTNTTLVLGNNNNTAAELRIQEPSQSGLHYSAFTAQAQDQNVTYTLPAESPANNEVLKVQSVSDHHVMLDWALPANTGFTMTRTDVAVSGAMVTLDVTGKSFIRITSASLAFNLTGFTGGIDGQVILVLNTSGKSMTIVNEDSSTTPASRIHTSSNSNIVKLSGEVSSMYIYDGAQGRWRLI
jgi:hypothetical protein